MSQNVTIYFNGVPVTSSPPESTVAAFPWSEQSWLLRLFQSDYFNTWIAVNYLHKYGHSVGIQHYLCQRLRTEFPVQDIQFLLPQLWSARPILGLSSIRHLAHYRSHVVVFGKSVSNALELLLLDLCRRAPHFTILLVWYMEAYLADLADALDSDAARICCRIHAACLCILMGTEAPCSHSTGQPHTQRPHSHQLATPNSLPVRRPSMPSQVERPLLLSRSRPQSVQANGFDTVSNEGPHLAPSLVSMGCMLGSVASPALAKYGLEMALPLLRNATDRGGASSSRSEPPSPPVGGQHHPLSSPAARTFPPIQRRAGSDAKRNRLLDRVRSLHQPSKNLIASPSLEELHTGNAFSLGRFLIKTGSIDELHTRRPSSSFTISEDLVLATAVDKDESSISQRRTSQGLPVRSGSRTPSSMVGVESCDGGSKSPSSMSSMSRALADRHYFHSEFQFVAALMDISNRLVATPKEARLSNLRAELALLNHNLPARVCVPLWCPATADLPYHHQIVRMAPDEAVVLNSADRVPYLILVEVVELCSDDSFPNGTGSSDHFNETPGCPDAPAVIQPIIVTAVKSTHNLATSVVPESYGVSSGFAEITEWVHDWTRPVSSLSHSSINEWVNGEVAEPSPPSNEFMDRMRTAAIMLSQLDRTGADQLKPQQQQLIRDRILREMIALEEQRVKKFLKGEEDRMDGDGEDVSMLESKMQGLMREDPSENWDMKRARIRQNSPYGKHPGWRLLSVIVKSGADLRQEQLACQLIKEMQTIWQQEGLSDLECSCRVLVTSDDGGLIETISNSISVHSIKKEAYARRWNRPGKPFTLLNYFQREFGPVSGDRFQSACRAFMQSLAAYSLVTYILAVKDRHNGNMLIDNLGHIIHIDFGFMLSNSPGSVRFEMAPFKLLQDYVDILGGLKSPLFLEWKNLIFQGLLALRKHADKVVLLVEMMQNESKFPCFGGNPEVTISQLRERFHLSSTEKQIEDIVERMVVSSYNNMTTRLYDNFQYYSNGIL